MPGMQTVTKSERASIRRSLVRLPFFAPVLAFVGLLLGPLAISRGQVAGQQETESLELYLPIVGHYLREELEPLEHIERPSDLQWIFRATRSARDLAVDPAAAELWVAAPGGILRWDLAQGSYTRFATSDGLPADEVQSIALEHDGTVWAATPGGLARWRAGAWDIPEGGPVESIEVVEVDAVGRVWSGGQGSLWRRSGEDWVRISLTGAEDSLVRDLLPVDSGAVWAATDDHGLFLVELDGRLRRFELEGETSESHVVDLAMDPDGRPWAVTPSRVFTYDAVRETWEPVESLPILEEGLRAATFDAAGRMWIADTQRLWIGDPGDEWQSLSGEDLPWDGGLHALVSAADGVWIATEQGVYRPESGKSGDGLGSGMTHRDPGTASKGDGSSLDWAVFDPGPGLPNQTVTALALDPQQGLWIGTEQGLSHRSPQGEWATFRSPTSLGDDRITALAVQPNGRAWVGTGSGLSRLEPSGAWLPDVKSPLAGVAVSALASGSNDELWVAVGSQLLLTHDGDTWTEIDLPGSGSEMKILSLLATDRGLWVGFDAGLWHLDAGMEWQGPEELGIGDESEFRQLSMDSDGRIWAVGSDALFVRGIEGAWEVVSALGDIEIGQVLAVQTSSDGSIWVADADRLLEGRVMGGQPRQSMGRNWREHPSMLTGMESGHLAVPPGRGAWFGGDRGLAHISGTEAGAVCSQAQSAPASASLAAELSDPDDMDLYVLELSEPFSKVEIRLQDPESARELYVLSSCNAIGAGGRHIGAGGRHIGPGGRHIGAARREGDSARLVIAPGWQTGSYYLMVRSRVEREDALGSYTIEIGHTEMQVDATRSLILTDREGMLSQHALSSSSETMRDWDDALIRLAEDPRVSGLVVDREAIDDDAVYYAWRDWRAGDGDTNRSAQALVRAISDWIRILRATELPALRYIVLVGDDRILPHARLRFERGADAGRGWKSEDEYLESSGIHPRERLGRALASGFTLSDDPYGSLLSAEVGDDDVTEAVSKRGLAVGRLVERPEDITSFIDAFLAGDSVMNIETSLVAADEDGEAAAAMIDGYLHASGLPVRDRKLFFAHEWTGEDVLESLHGLDPDVVAFALPSDHDALYTRSRARIDVDALAPPVRRPRLVLATGAHAGLNIPGLPGVHARPRDIAEVWQGVGGSVIATTGWSYGMGRDFEASLAYSDALFAALAHRLTAGNVTVLGDALLAAKRDYLLDVTQIDAFHEHTVAGTLLYGLPMQRVQVPQHSAREDINPVQLERHPDVRLDPVNLLSEDLAVRRAELRIPEMQRRDLADGSYKRVPGEGSLHLQAGAPVQPRLRLRVPSLDHAGQEFAPRGLVWLGGQFDVEAASDPVVRAARIRGQAGDAPFLSDPRVGLHPLRPAWLRMRSDQDVGDPFAVSAAEARLLVVAGQYDAEARSARYFETLSFDFYYARSSDHRPPRILDVERRGGTILVDVGDREGKVLRVVLTYESDDNRWASSEFGERPDGRWESSMPAGAAALIQAVDDSGNIEVLELGSRLP